MTAMCSLSIRLPSDPTPQCLSFLSLPLDPLRVGLGKSRARAVSQRSISNPTIAKPVTTTRRSGCFIPSSLHPSPRLAFLRKQLAAPSTYEGGAPPSLTCGVRVLVNLVK